MSKLEPRAPFVFELAQPESHHSVCWLVVAVLPARLPHSDPNPVQSTTTHIIIIVLCGHHQRWMPLKKLPVQAALLLLVFCSCCYYCVVCRSALKPVSQSHTTQTDSPSPQTDRQQQQHWYHRYGANRGQKSPSASKLLGNCAQIIVTEWINAVSIYHSLNCRDKWHVILIELKLCVPPSPPLPTDRSLGLICHVHTRHKLTHSCSAVVDDCWSVGWLAGNCRLGESVT